MIDTPYIFPYDMICESAAGSVDTSKYKVCSTTSYIVGTYIVSRGKYWYLTIVGLR